MRPQLASPDVARRATVRRSVVRGPPSSPDPRRRPPAAAAHPRPAAARRPAPARRGRRRRARGGGRPRGGAPVLAAAPLVLVGSDCAAEVARRPTCPGGRDDPGRPGPRRRGGVAAGPGIGAEQVAPLPGRRGGSPSGSRSAAEAPRAAADVSRGRRPGRGRGQTLATGAGRDRGRPRPGASSSTATRSAAAWTSCSARSRRGFGGRTWPRSTAGSPRRRCGGAAVLRRALSLLSWDRGDRSSVPPEADAVALGGRAPGERPGRRRPPAQPGRRGMTAAPAADDGAGRRAGRGPVRRGGRPGSGAAAGRARRPRWWCAARPRPADRR